MAVSTQAADAPIVIGTVLWPLCPLRYSLQPYTELQVEGLPVPCHE